MGTVISYDKRTPLHIELKWISVIHIMDKTQKIHSNYFSCVHSFVFCSLLNLSKSIFFTHELLLQLQLHVTLVFVILLILPWEDFFSSWLLKFNIDNLKYWMSVLIVS